MNLIGAGPGSRTTLGAGLLITTGAGCILTAAGDGGLVRRTAIPTIVRSGRRLMFRFTGLAVDSVSVADGVRLAGFPLDRVTTSIRGMGGMVGASAIATSVHSIAA